MAPSYFSSKMNILVAGRAYPESLPGDEPEPLPQVRWPLSQLMTLLEEEDFNRSVTLARFSCCASGCRRRAAVAPLPDKSAHRRFFFRRVRGSRPRHR